MCSLTVTVFIWFYSTHVKTHNTVTACLTGWTLSWPAWTSHGGGGQHRLLSTMLFSYDNNVVTTLFSHHRCNNLLTSWYRHVNDSEHCCSINTNFFLFPTTMNNLVASSLLNNIVETMLNIVSTEHSLLTILHKYTPSHVTHRHS